MPTTARFALCALLILPAFLQAQTPPAGDKSKWQVTMSMQMASLSMPSQTANVCAGGGEHDAPPISTRKDCEVYDAKRTGNTQSFKMRCTGQMAMEGSGEFTYDSADHYRGKINMKAAQGDMSMTYEGQRLGKCDGTEVNGEQTKAEAQSQLQSLQNNPKVQDALKKAQEALKNAGQP